MHVGASGYAWIPGAGLNSRAYCCCVPETANSPACAARSGWDAAAGGCDECPVERITFFDVQEFIRRLNAARPWPGFRLPTEAGVGVCVPGRRPRGLRRVGDGRQDARELRRAEDDGRRALPGERVESVRHGGQRVGMDERRSLRVFANAGSGSTCELRLRPEGHPRRQLAFRCRQRTLRIALHPSSAGSRLQPRRPAGPRRRMNCYSDFWNHHEHTPCVHAALRI
jgi:hypothetical protein